MGITTVGRFLLLLHDAQHKVCTSDWLCSFIIPCFWRTGNFWSSFTVSLQSLQLCTLYMGSWAITTHIHTDTAQQFSYPFIIWIQPCSLKYVLPCSSKNRMWRMSVWQVYNSERWSGMVPGDAWWDPNWTVDSKRLLISFPYCGI